jgi:hypothetical protein|tara:strand:- start:18012 stop:18302 length:291 start_codon:yes stop_codon:yes gene_type:complete
MPTKKEREHMDLVAQLGCFICRSPANLHHIRPKGTGIGRRSSHMEVIPLCYEHHQGKFSVHGSPKKFKAEYGTEKEMLEQVLEQVNLLRKQQDVFS